MLTQFPSISILGEPSNAVDPEVPDCTMYCIATVRGPFA